MGRALQGKGKHGSLLINDTYLGLLFHSWDSSGMEASYCNLIVSVFRNIVQFRAYFDSSSLRLKCYISREYSSLKGVNKT